MIANNICEERRKTLRIEKRATDRLGLYIGETSSQMECRRDSIEGMDEEIEEWSRTGIGLSGGVGEEEEYKSLNGQNIASVVLRISANNETKHQLSIKRSHIGHNICPLKNW